jgi:hypothetical protein
MIHLTAENLEVAYHKLNQLFTDRSSIVADISANKFRNDVFLNAFDIVIETENHINTMSLESMGYTKSKISHLLRTYLDLDQFWGWIEKIKSTTNDYERVDSDILLRTTDNSKHGNGPCLLGISYRSHRNPNLTVYSRSAELPQIFGGDTLLISAICDIISEELSIITGIQVTWFISSARIKSRSANYYRLMIHPMRISYRDSEFQRHIEKQWDNILANPDKQVTFSKLVKLQEMYQSRLVHNDYPDSLTYAVDFIKRLRENR